MNEEELNEYVNKEITNRIYKLLNQILFLDKTTGKLLLEYPIARYNLSIRTRGRLKLIVNCKSKEVKLFHLLNTLASPVSSGKHKGCSRLSLVTDNDGTYNLVKTEEME